MTRCEATVLLILFLLLAAGRLSAAPDTVVRDCLTEISASINPVYDGYVGAAWLSHGKITFAWCGSGQACYDGEIREALFPAKTRWRTVISLGENSAFRREHGVWSQSPRLVAHPAEELYVLNLNCYRDFPEKSGPNSGHPTGNVVVYDASSGLYTNLTKRDWESGRYVEALRWFPDERVLLLEESALSSGSDSPSPVPGTGKPICINLDGGKPARSTWPKIDEWYAARPSTRVVHEEPFGARDRQIRWTIESRALKKKIALQSVWAPGVRAFVIPGGLFCIGNEQLGTHFYNREGELLASIPEVPLGYAEACNQILLRSRRADEDGQYRYWLFDTAKYAEVLAPEARTNGN